MGFAAAAIGSTGYLLWRLRAAQRERDEERLRKQEIAFQLVRHRNGLMHTEESSRNGTFGGFQPSAGDVFVATYPKCGTTWMTHIVHGLRSGGDMSFGEITEVVPWDIMATICGQDLDGARRVRLRAFKSHESFGTICKTAGATRATVGDAKYIYVIRDPKDAFLSFYHFLPAYVGLRSGDISMRLFCDAIFAGVSHSGTIWEHLLGWWKVREHENVLFIHFETMLRDLRGSVETVAAFLGVEADAALLEKVTAQSSYAFMSRPENKRHFDDHFVFSKVRDAMGIPKDVTFTMGKVRKGGGKSGGGRKAIPPYVQRRLNERWAEVVEAATGFATYDELREDTEALNAARRFA